MSAFQIIHDAQLAQSLATAAERGCDILNIDWRDITQPSDALALLAQRAAFPDYFGGNLDALYDVLSERVDVRQTWLIRSTPAQEKLLFPILDTMRDALSADGDLIVLWWLNV